eukprot:scaffold16337_cov34-Phaeocystis_antarctica.AAC.1
MHSSCRLDTAMQSAARRRAKGRAACSALTASAATGVRARNMFAAGEKVNGGYAYKRGRCPRKKTADGSGWRG